MNYEERINSNAPIPRSKRKLDADEPDEFEDETAEEGNTVDGPNRKKISLTEVAQYEGEEFLGVFWPQHVYESFFGEKLGKRLQNVVVPGAGSAPRGCAYAPRGPYVGH